MSAVHPEAARPPASRRQRQRDATVEEILAVAAELLGRDGATGLTIRSLARELGLAPSALYRYYPSRDALLTALIDRAFAGLADAVAAAGTPEHSLEAMLAACHAFRRWSLDHPHEFGLIFGTPVPGYEWPQDLNGNAVRLQAELLALLTRGLQQGRITIADVALPPALSAPLKDFHAADKFDALSPGEAIVALQFWLVLLGAVAGEVFCHLPLPIVAVGEPFFDHTMRRTLAAMGCSEADLAATRSPGQAAPAVVAPGVTPPQTARSEQVG